MPLRLDSQSADFSTRFRAFLAVKREAAQDVEQSVRRILAEVKAHGDRALLQLTLEFDRLDLAKVSMRVSADEIEAAAKSCEPQALAALKLARERIEAYHRRQKPADERFTDALGVEMGSRWTAIEAVGLYVPGGTAAYPSSVLMNAVPAKVAGCARLVMAVPAPDGKLEPLVLDPNASPAQRMHGLWAMIGRGPLEPSFHVKLLSLNEPSFVAWGVRAAGNQGRVEPIVRQKLLDLPRASARVHRDTQLQGNGILARRDRARRACHPRGQAVQLDVDRSLVVLAFHLDAKDLRLPGLDDQVLAGQGPRRPAGLDRETERSAFDCLAAEGSMHLDPLRPFQSSGSGPQFHLKGIGVVGDGEDAISHALRQAV